MDFLERLIDEEKDLLTKIVALDKFIYITPRHIKH